MKKIFVATLTLLLLTTFSNHTYAANVPTRPVQEEIIYDIVIDRFNNARQLPSEQVDVNDPFTYNGGDLAGITQMLDDIQQYGFTAISLSPVMENAPKGYHGYWIVDFYKVEEEFGTMEDLTKLVEAAHERGLKVYMELVTNFVHESSPLVSEKLNDGWFKEVETVDIDGPFYWLGNVKQFDQENEEVERFLLDVALYWMEEVDIDGYVLHAADFASSSFLETLANEIKKKDTDFAIIANTLQNDAFDRLCQIEAIDAVADLKVMETIQQVLAHPDEPIAKLYDLTKNSDCSKRLLFADTKNTPRFPFLFRENGRNEVTTWTLTLAYLYFTPGVPIVYQGSEVPMYGQKFPENQLMYDAITKDPELEKVFKRLSSMRKEFKPLVHGDFEQIAVEQGFSLFKRTYEGETVYVGINNDSESRVVVLDGIDENKQLRGLLQDETVRAHKDGKFYVGLPRESAEVFIIEENKGINWGFNLSVIFIVVLFVLAVVYLSMKQKRREKNV